MPERIEQLARGVAQGMRGDAELDYDFSYPVTMNDEAAARAALGVIRDLFGEENTLKLSNPSMGGEDFAFFLEKIPGAFIWLGVGEDVSYLHTPTFDFDEEILPHGAALLTALALEKLGRYCKHAALRAAFSTPASQACQPGRAVRFSAALDRASAKEGSSREALAEQEPVGSKLKC